MSVDISKTAQGYILKSSLILHRPRKEVFPFFADARNLDRITPARLRFKILNSDPIEMRTGTVIDYALRIHGIPIRWRSEISVWEPPFRFVDEQRRGPYKFWRHEHYFEEHDGKTIMRDEVNYSLYCSSIAHPLIVRNDLVNIFNYRQQAIKQIFVDE